MDATQQLSSQDHTYSDTSTPIK